MPSDITRRSFDDKRQYRSVVMQQGRVTVDADFNEAGLIASEEDREEALDFVGPAGTPDDGYLIQGTGASRDFTAGAGTMYVGGMRAFTLQPILYSNQSDWLDRSTDPDWVDPAAIQSRGPEEIYLLLREQEVSAVEDTALRDVALGGPDTAQRTRLIQHIARVSTAATTCDGARSSFAQHFASQGLVPHYNTMRLTSSATLRVTFPRPNSTPGPCDPPATGGYLGADNQLIRVQIASINAGVVRFVWGYDDASFLYRVQVVDNQHLRLFSSPVDQYHHPQSGQAVEVLRSAASLGGTNYIASATGIVVTLTTSYDADAKTITLPTALPAEYLDLAASPAVFLRVWSKEAVVTPGTPMDLGDTGLRVTLRPGATGFHVGDHWLIAVRPSTPTKVYPQRFLEADQPPDGPRLWFCPLAVVSWTEGVLRLLEDCRNPFDNLVELTRRNQGGCCTIIVRAGENLQRVLDRYQNREKIVICLMPGTYLLDAPLRLGSQHSNLTIEACHDGAVLRAAPGREEGFVDGLVVLVHADNVTLRGLRFVLPQVPFRRAGGRLAFLDRASVNDVEGVTRDLFVSIGVRPVHCALLAIENCLFRFSLTQNMDVFGVGIFASSECWGFRLTGTRFVHEDEYLRNEGRPFRLLIGYLLMPSVSVRSKGLRAAARGRVLARTILQDARIEENLFSGITIAAMVMAATGVVEIERNTVRDCRAGFWLLSLSSVAFSPTMSQVKIRRAELEIAEQWREAFASAMEDPLLVIGSTIARSYPLPAEFKQEDDDGKAEPPAKVKTVKSRMQAAVDKILKSFLADGSGKTDEEVQLTEMYAKAAVDAGLRTFLGLHEQLAAVERADPGASVKLALTLTLTSNEIDARVVGVSSNMCFLVIDEDIETASSLTMVGNIMQMHAPTAPAVAIMQMERCAITGNVVINDSRKGGRSLTLFPGGGRAKNTVAVTGNVFQGPSILPPREATIPAPMNNWHFFNSES